MLIGQSILAPVADPAIYFSPWFPRQGDECRVVIEAIRASGNVTFTCQVQTKNNEDVDPGTNVGSAISVTTSTSNSVTTNAIRTGFKELVRYEFSAHGSQADQWIHFRSNPPIWEPN